MKPLLNKFSDVGVSVLHGLATEADELQFTALLASACERGGRNAEHVSGVLWGEQGVGVDLHEHFRRG